MRRLLPFILFLVSGCGGNSADPREIENIFNKHGWSASPGPVARVFSGTGSLRSIDAYAVVSGPGLRPERDYPAPLKAGAGLTLWETAGGFAVVKVFPGSPAAAAGLKAGDILTKVDGKPAAGITAAARNAFFYGQKGGEFSFTGSRKDGSAISGFLKRDLGAMPAVWGFLVPGERTAYLRIASFSDKTAEAVKAELTDLAASGAAAVILDLRHNYGGSLDGAAGTLGLFSPGPGALFRTVSARAGYVREYSAKKTGPYPGIKLAVLIDHGSVSRAEIFAASLREAGRAFTAGGPTAGNVSITKTFRLTKGGTLRLTVARLVTPAGKDLDGRGLAPDLPVKDLPGGRYAFSNDFPPPLASGDPVIGAALAKLR